MLICSFCPQLGGKNACIVFDDAELSKCVPGIVRSSFLNQGEICLCTSRIFIQKSIFAEFIEKFVTETRSADQEKSCSAGG